MNIQAIMKQAQTMQKEMQKISLEISETEFVADKEMVKIVVYGNKIIKSIEFKHAVDEEDLEIFSDIVLVEINNLFKEIDKVTEQKMGKFANVPGLF